MGMVKVVSVERHLVLPIGYLSRVRSKRDSNLPWGWSWWLRRDAAKSIPNDDGSGFPSQRTPSPLSPKIAFAPKAKPGCNIPRERTRRHPTEAADRLLKSDCGRIFLMGRLKSSSVLGDMSLSLPNPGTPSPMEISTHRKKNAT